MKETINRAKLHVDQVKRGKADVEPRADMPGVEFLYEKYGRDNPFVRNALSLWEKCPDVSIEQALVELVDALVKQNDAINKAMLDMVQNSTRPVVIGGSATGSRVITGSNNIVKDSRS